MACPMECSYGMFPWNVPMECSDGRGHLVERRAHAARLVERRVRVRRAPQRPRGGAEFRETRRLRQRADAAVRRDEELVVVDERAEQLRARRVERDGARGVAVVVAVLAQVGVVGAGPAPTGFLVMAY